MAAANSNLIAKQCALYNALRVQVVARQEMDVVEAQLQAIADEYNTSCASYASLMNYRPGQFDDNSASATISIVDLTSTNDGQGANSSEDE
ncbi:Hydroxymethylglutaryl-CoA lyase, mitochondrial [Hordeum vulgare]|nr:Hydroxymethylglutaryl-CoA lyase, mitochondrial [Hordeum vulgare]